MRRLVAALMILLVCFAVLFVGWQRARERYIIPWLGDYLARQVQRRTGWELNYRSLTGSLFNDVELHTVRLTPPPAVEWLKAPAGSVAVTADHVRATYTPLDLLRHRIRRIEVDGCHLQLGQTRLNIGVAQVGDMTAINVPPQDFPLADARMLFSLPEQVETDGQVRIGGEALLKSYRPHLMQVRLHGRDLRIGWGALLDARTDIDLELNGPSPTLVLGGTIDVTKGRWTGVGTSPLGAALGADQPALFKWAAWFPGSVRIHITGSNLWLHTDQLHAKLRADLMLQKSPDGPPRFIGQLEAVEGSYQTKAKRFALRRGSIVFHGEPTASPELDATLETRVKRYRIRAMVHGTLRDSHLELTSQPELSRNEILSLLIFGRHLNRLSAEERARLTQQDDASQALDLLFLGRAEVIAAKWLGLDEINVNVSPDVTAGLPTTRPIESVEIGKYVIPNRLFGSYQLEPNRVPGEPLKHTVGAEYEFTDTFSVGGTLTAEVRGQQPQPGQTINSTATTATAQDPGRRLQAEEALIRFRWKF